MIKYPLLLCALLLAACGSSTRKIQQSRSHSEVNTVLTGKTSITTISEIDTTIVIPADSLQVSLQISGDTIIRRYVTNNGMDLMATFNPKTKTFTAAAHRQEQKVPVKATQTTTQESNISVSQQEIASRSDYSKETTSSAKVKWGVVILLVLLIACFVVFKFLRIIK